MTLLVLLTAMACIAAPLLTYSLSLAALGLPHVLVELRYVQRRFGQRVMRRTAVAMAALLLGVVGLRVARNLGWTVPTSWELLLVVALVAVVLPALGWRWRGFGVVLVVTGLLGALVSPLHSLLLLAVLHNLTPVGFLAEVLSGQRRRNAMALGTLLFVGIPLLIATGLPFDLLSLWSWTAPDLSFLPTGPLSSQLGAYLPPEWQDRPWATHAFSGVVFAQCMHYAAVLHVLPRLQHGVHTPRFGFGVVLLTAGLFLLFVGNFADGRRWYGVLAAVHAWVELPILLLAFGTLRPGAVPRGLEAAVAGLPRTLP